MFCGYCGTENKPGVNFCQNCGKALVNKENQVNFFSKAQTQNEAENEKKVFDNKKPLPGKILICIAAVFLLLIVIIAVIINLKPTIKLDDYITFEASGYDGYGEVHYDIDWEAIKEKYGEKLSFTSKAKQEYGGFLGMMTPIDAITENISVTLDPNSNLSNGDEVKYTWIVDQELSDYVTCKFKYSDGVYETSGLTEVGSFDAFSDLEVTYSGKAPNGQASVKYNGSELSNYDFECDRNNGLKNGDTIKVTIRNSDPSFYAKSLGKVPESFEKEYEVSGLDEYVSSYKDLDDEFVNKLKADAEDTIYSYTASSYNKTSSLDNLSYNGYIMLTSKDDSMWGGSENNLYIIYSGDISNTDGKFRTSKVYFPVRFSDILKTSDGLSYEHNHGISGYSNIDGSGYSTNGYINPLECYIDIVEANRDSYTAESGDGFEVYSEYVPIGKISDIDDSFKKELENDAVDMINNYVEKDLPDGSTASDVNLKGEYLMIAKNQGGDFSKNNIYVLVYSATVSNENERFDTFNVYFPIEYDGLVNLPENGHMVTATRGIIGSTTIPDSYYSVKGYTDGEEMYSKVITSNRNNYTYEVSDGIKEFGN